MLDETSFLPGQRWISTGEAELGLGVVESADRRSVVLSFPAAAERRTYSRASAPLSRVLFEAGDRITDVDGADAQVLDRRSADGRAVYRVQDTDGREREIDEIAIGGTVALDEPRARLLSGRIDPPAAFALRAEALGHRSRVQASPVHGLLGARVQLLPHQLYIAAEVGARHAPRVLLADEVGLGKTIEAGLIVHQQLVLGRAARVLVLTPASLLYQWLVEMLRRFNLRFMLVDEDACDDAAAHAENPFEAGQLCLSPIELVADREALSRAAIEAQWDVVVVDEAHHLTWSADASSPAYRLVEQLAASSPGLLLLTATPEQLGVDGHFARLRLLDPARHGDLEAFRAEEARFLETGALVDMLLATSPDQPEQLRAALDRVEAALGHDASARLERAIDDGDTGTARTECVRELLDRRGTGRVLFRNTRRAIGGFPVRRVHRHELAQPPAWAELEAAAEPSMAPYPEHVLGPEWLELDPRVEWLVEWLRRHRAEKALLICALGSTARELEQHLRVRHGARSCVFHEHMDLIARDRSAAYFAAVEDGAQILACSEIGSEGRNFQHAHHLILFDLPPDLELLEQRIGRLDRIGQRAAVEIHVPYIEQSVQHALLDFYHDGLGALEQPFPAPARLAGSAAAGSEQFLAARTDAGARATLIAETQQVRESLVAEIEAGRDRLLELSSFDEAVAGQVIEDIVDTAKPKRLADFLERALDLVGVELAAQPGGQILIRPTERATEAGMLGLGEEPLAATCDRLLALDNEDWQFLSWEHPLVSATLDLLLEGSTGSATIGTMTLAPLESGTVLVEGIFGLHCAAPRHLRLDRYLAGAGVRVVLDGEGRDYAAALPAARVDRGMEAIPTSSVGAVASRLREPLVERLAQAERLAGERRQTIVDEALADARRALGAEIVRLESLQRINPAIRPDEVDALRAQADATLAALERTRLRLDAIRVIVVV